MLSAIIEGLCQWGPHEHRLQNWIPVIIKELEIRKNYSVLIEVSERVIVRLIRTLSISSYRPLTYPVFRKLLYSVPTPHVFYKVSEMIC